MTPGTSILLAVGLSLASRGVARANSLLVSDSTHVLVYDASSGASQGVFVAPGSGGITLPRKMLARDDLLYLGNFGYPGVARFNLSNGSFVDALYPTPYGAINANGMAFGADENLYVTSSGSNRVLRFDGTTGALIDAFVATNTGGLNFPDAVAFGADGNLYVCSGGTQQVLRYNGTTGAFMDIFVTAGSGGLNGALGMIFGPDGNIYICSSATNQVLRYNGTTGAFMGVFVAAGSGGLNQPLGMAFGPDGNLYVCSSNTNQVLRYNGTTGAFMDIFVTAGSGGLSQPINLLFMPPKTPTALIASSVTGSQVLLDWNDNSTDETGFAIWRRGGGSDWSRIAVLAVNSIQYIDTSVTAGIPYSYQVRAISNVGASGWSNTVNVTPPAPVPAPPTSLTATAIAPGQVYLSWASSSPNLTGFALQRKIAGGAWTSLGMVGGSTTGYVDSGLQSNTIYSYRVRAVNNVAVSDWSDEAVVWTPLVPPAAPSGLTATAISSSQINLSWTVNSTNETAVTVWRKTGGGSFARVAVLAPGSASYSDTGLSSGTSYTYEVRAINDYYASGWSNTAMATTF
jgi:fibronectin type III domain protein